MFCLLQVERTKNRQFKSIVTVGEDRYSSSFWYVCFIQRRWLVSGWTVLFFVWLRV